MDQVVLLNVALIGGGPMLVVGGLAQLAARYVRRGDATLDVASRGEAQVRSAEAERAAPVKVGAR